MSTNYETVIGTGFGIFMVLYVLILLGMAAAIYVLNAIGLNNMAKKMNHPQPWMAWIPGANMYLMCTLPTKEYQILLLKKTYTDRRAGFWAWLIMIGAGMVIGLFSAIPFIGWIIAILGYPAIVFGSVVTGYPILKDLFDLFHDNKKSMIFSIISIAVPAAQCVFMFITGRGEPIHPNNS